MADTPTPQAQQSPPKDQGKVEPPKVKTEAERRTAIAAEYETLLSQSQDELSIVKALCSKYSLDEVALKELMAESRGVKGAKGAPAQPAHPGQMGTAPAQGTVQSGKEPKTS